MPYASPSKRRNYGAAWRRKHPLYMRNYYRNVVKASPRDNQPMIAWRYEDGKVISAPLLK